MDAVEFIKVCVRMCDNYDSCVGCPARGMGGCSIISTNTIKIVPIVEKWTKEHPIKTRQSELLQLFPNAKIDNTGTLSMCPMNFDQETYKDKDKCFCIHMHDDINCAECRRDFWLKEIE